jgi:hypothetical protein
VDRWVVLAGAGVIVLAALGREVLRWRGGRWTRRGPGG